MSFVIDTAVIGVRCENPDIELWPNVAVAVVVAIENLDRRLPARGSYLLANPCYAQIHQVPCVHRQP